MLRGWRGAWVFILTLLIALLARGGMEVREGARRSLVERERGRAERASTQAPMPPGLQEAYITSLQAEAGAGYEVTWLAGGLVAENPAQALAVAFSANGVEVEARGVRTTLRPTRWGCEEALHEVARAMPEMHEGRVEYRREGLVEWYVNGPLGVEQGFSVADAPRCERGEAGRLRVDLALGAGFSAVLAANGKDVELRDATGERVLGYSDLIATDARGQALPAQLEVTSDGVSIRIEAVGATYPVVIDPLIWKEQKLLASDGATGQRFGASVSLDGDTAIVGAPYANTVGQEAGAAYVFVRSGTSWVQQQKLVASDEAAGDHFGVSVAISGDTAVIGAMHGVAYVFVRSGSTWVQQQRFVIRIKEFYYGPLVAIEGDTVLAGLPSEDDPNHSGIIIHGVVAAYTRSGSTWAAQDLAFASYGSGEAIALSGDTALAGAPYQKWNDQGKSAGAAYVFVRSDMGWSLQQILQPSDGTAGDFFGGSVVLSGDTAMLSGQDSTYVFTRSGSTWTEQQKLQSSDGSVFPVALSGDTALLQGASALYVFVRSGSVWTEQKKLVPGDLMVGNASGALWGKTALVGVSGADGMMPSMGAVYVFAGGLSAGDACTTNNACSSRSCIDGVCVDPLASCAGAADGTPCDDGNVCTRQDTCKGGECVGGVPVVCPEPFQEECLRAVCLPTSATCGITQKLDGAPCSGGLCIAGGCFSDISPSSSVSGTTGTSSTGMSGSASSSASAGGAGASGGSTSGSSGAGGFGGAPEAQAEIHLHGGGGCAMCPGSNQSAAAMLLALLAVRGRRRSRARRPQPGSRISMR